MKKLTALLIITALFAGNVAQAQQAEKSSGRGAASGTTAGSEASEPFAWGIALGALALIGTVVGVVASTATQPGN